MPGLIFRAPDRRLEERFAEGWRFTATWPTQPTVARRQLALLSLDGRAFEAIALMKRGRMPATYAWHISFEPVRPFDAEIDRPRAFRLAAALRRGAPASCLSRPHL